MDEQQQLLYILALLNGKAGGQITGADLSRAEDPILGLLTNTLVQTPNPGPNLEDLSFKLRPTWESLKNNEYYDETSIEMKIARSIADGVPLMEVRKQIPQELAKAGQPSGPNDSTTQELLAFATKLSDEQQNYNVKIRDTAGENNQNTWWAKAGIPDPSLKPSTEGMMAPLLQRVAQMYAPTPKTAKQQSGENAQRKLEEIRTTKVRDSADAELEARTSLQNGQLPYSAGGSPQMTDFLGSMRRQQVSDYGSGNPLKILNAATGLSFLTGLTNTAGDYITDLGADVFQGPERKRKLEEKYIRSKGAEAMSNPETREMEQMLVRQQAMSGNLSSNKKNSVPIRTDLVNKQREDKAQRVAAILQGRADKRAENMPTPAQQVVMNRILSLALAEKMKK